MNNRAPLSTLTDAATGLLGRQFDDVECRIEVISPWGGVQLELKDGVVRHVGSADGRADLVLHGDASSGLPIPDDASQDATWRAGLAWRIGGTSADPQLLDPFDRVDLNWARDIPVLPGVDVAWASTVLGSPFGDAAVSYVVRDGQPVQVLRGVIPSVDVRFRFKLDRVVRARAGQIGVPETLDDGGSCEGDLDALLLIAGLQETEPWVAARRIGPEAASAIALFISVAETGLFDALRREAAHEA